MDGACAERVRLKGKIMDSATERTLLLHGAVKRSIIDRTRQIRALGWRCALTLFLLIQNYRQSYCDFWSRYVVF